MSRLLLGAHMSIAGGLEKAFDRAEAINCTCMQIFTKSNRQWLAKPLTTETIKAFKKRAKKSPVKPVIVHASYLINIGAQDPKLRELSRQALEIELNRCNQLSIPYLVLHPGVAKGNNVEITLNLIAQELNTLLQTYKGEAMILLENTAGQGSSIGYSFGQLHDIYVKIKDKKHIGFCFDTCHAFAAGYQFNTSADYTAMWSQFDKLLGINKLKAMHINDAKKECGSRVDRHAHLGHGKIGLNAFALLFNDARFFDIPKILETPIEKDPTEYRKDMEVIHSLLTPRTKQTLGL